MYLQDSSHKPLSEFIDIEGCKVPSDADEKEGANTSVD